jgi:hypothetical protein
MLQTLPAGSHGQERGHDGRDKYEDLNGRTENFSMNLEIDSLRTKLANMTSVAKSLS